MSPTQIESSSQNILKKATVFYRSHKLLIELGIVVVLAIIVAGLYYQRPSIAHKVSEVVLSGKIEDCKQFENVSVPGTATNYASVCADNISRKQAIADGDISRCDSLDTRYLNPEHCKTEVKMATYQSKGVDECSLVSGSEYDLCVNTTALKKLAKEKIPNACEGVRAGKELDTCYSMIVGDALARSAAPACDSFAGDVKTECMAAASLLKITAEQCDEFKTVLGAVMCQQKFLLQTNTP
jgi:hypothetical protein